MRCSCKSSCSVCCVELQTGLIRCTFKSCHMCKHQSTLETSGRRRRINTRQPSGLKEGESVWWEEATGFLYICKQTNSWSQRVCSGCLKSSKHSTKRDFLTMTTAAAPHITSCKLLLFFYCTNAIYTHVDLTPGTSCGRFLGHESLKCSTVQIK